MTLTKNRPSWVILWIVFAPCAWATPLPAGKLVSATGQVSAVNPVRVSRALKSGDLVFEGDILSSKASSSAKFLMNDQSILDLNPSSQLLVEHFELRGGGDREVSISVLSGKIRASVNKPILNGGKFTIRTRTAVMGVRGTEFVVQSANQGGQSQLTVMKGLVQVAPAAAGAAPIAVSPGNQLTVASGSPPQLVRLSADQLASVARGATVRDVTFGNSVDLSRSLSKGGSAAVTAALATAASESASRSPASRSSDGVATASIPGVGGRDSLVSQALPLSAGQTVKVNVKFSP